MRWSIAAGYRIDDPAGPALAAALPRHTAPTEHLASLPHAEVAAALAELAASNRVWPPTAGALERAYQRSDLLAARREVMEAWGRHITQVAR